MTSAPATAVHHPPRGRDDADRRLFKCPRQCPLQLQRRLKTLARILIKTRSNYALQCRRDRQRRRLLVENSGDDGGRIRTVEGPAASEHFVQHATEREQVAARIGFLALQLLRRHVLQRAHHFAFARDGLRERGVGFLERSAVLGQSKIQQLNPRARYQDIGGLQIAMRNAFFVRGIQRIQNLIGVFGGLFERQRPMQRRAVDVLHHQIIGADIVDLADVRMIERRHRARLAFKAFAEFLLGDLQRDNAIQPGVARFPDLSRATGTELRNDFVGAQSVARGKRHVIKQSTLLKKSRKTERGA